MTGSRTIIAALVACTLAGLTTSATLAQTNGAVLPHRSTAKPPPTHRTAVCTSYCSRCCGSVTYSGKRLTAGMCAADLRYHPLGTRIAFGPPVNRVLTVEDSGGNVHGRDRFDIAQGIVAKCKCRVVIGRRKIAYRVVGR